MSESRSNDEAANVLGDLFRMSGVGFVCLDGVVTVPGSVRKSGLTLVRFLHYRADEYNGDKNSQGEGKWDRTCRYLRNRRDELKAAITYGIRDRESGAFCIVGTPGRSVHIWSASKGRFGEYLKGSLPWEEIPIWAQHLEGMK